MSDFITVLRETCPTPVLDATKWKRIGGDPHTVNLNAYLSKDGSKIMGTWICTPGKFEVNYEKWEYCHFLDGYCIITPEGEEPQHLKAGVTGVTIQVFPVTKQGNICAIKMN